ncbi:MAG TPA: hypothetical protein PLJ65_03190, partial [Casimicrobium sp.]|nr:hypothetical protein [Casimicrobium sp.]
QFGDEIDRFVDERDAKTVYLITELPSKVVASDVIFIVLMSLGLSLLATLYPSWRASRVNPAEALRYD